MCMIDGADGDWTNLGQTTRKARKRHRCYECSRWIEPGETYEDARGVGDGYIMVMRSCAHCVQARRWLVSVCSGYLWGAVAEDLAEHWTEEWTLRCLDLGRLVVWQRNDWRTRSGDLLPVEAVTAATDRARRYALDRIASAKAA